LRSGARPPRPRSRGTRSGQAPSRPTRAPRPEARARRAIAGPACRTGRRTAGGRSAGASAPRGSGSWPSSGPRSADCGAAGAGASPGFGGRASRPPRARPRRAAWPAFARRGGRSSPARRGSRWSVGETTITSATWGSMIRLVSQALPVTSSATRSSAPRLRANSSTCSGFVSIRPAERTSPPFAIATSQNSRWTSNPIALTCSSSLRMTGEAAGKRHRRIRARSATGSVAGAAAE
jgi:hypothetical protein